MEQNGDEKQKSSRVVRGNGQVGSRRRLRSGIQSAVVCAVLYTYTQAQGGFEAVVRWVTPIERKFPYETVL